MDYTTHSQGTRQHTKHDGSNICPVQKVGYGIVAFDKFGVEHHSAHSDIDYKNWSWTLIEWWRYDDDSMLDILTFR